MKRQLFSLLAECIYVLDPLVGDQFCLSRISLILRVLGIQVMGFLRVQTLLHPSLGFLRVYSFTLGPGYCMVSWKGGGAKAPLALQNLPSSLQICRPRETVSVPLATSPCLRHSVSMPLHPSLMVVYSRYPG